MFMDREKIRKALEAAYAEIVEPDEPEDTFAACLEDFGKTGGFDFPVSFIADTITEAVESLAGKKFAWYWEPLIEECSYTGEFAFIMVDPDTARCLTFDRETLSVAVVTTLENVEQAIDLVSYLLKCCAAAE
jgi:hypothetical protein